MHEESPLWAAIELWGKLTGVKVGADGEVKAHTIGDWNVRDAYHGLREALKLDPTEITATLMFKVYVMDWLKSATTNMQDLLDNPDKIGAQVTTAKKLLAIIDRDEIVEARDAFIERLREGLAHYGAADREDVKALLAKPDVVAILRRDALRSLQNLRVDQFLDGQGEDPQVKPVYVESIRQYWNINSFLGAMTATPSGVCLAMIRDPFIYDTFFAFAIRNGANLFVLTDVPEHAHPLASKMARRPDKAMNARISRNWYPYELLNVDWDEEGRLIFAASEETGVAVYDEDGVKTKKIGEIGAPETIWLTMMLDLIVQKFWKQGFKAPQLSYTGEMIRPENEMALLARAAHLPTTNVKTLGLSSLTVADIGPDAAHDEKALGKKGGDHNAWLERRYAPALSDAPLNLLGHAGDVFKITPADGQAVKVAEKDKERALNPFFKHDIAAARKVATIEPMRLTAFGTAEQLDADRKFLARATYAKQVQVLADAEYERRKDEVLAWFQAKVTANRARLLEVAALGEVWVGRAGGEGFSAYATAHGAEHRVGEGALRQTYSRFLMTYDISIPSKNLDYGDLVSRHAGFSLGSYENYGRGEVCAVNEAKATYTAIFSPHTAADIAWLCGVAVQDLPDVLQHHDVKADHAGNHLLNRIDPVSWMVRNPWLKLDFRVKAPLSKSGRKALEKLYPHPRPPEHLNCFRRTRENGGYEPLIA
ncbi:hypothetical protein DOMOVOI_02960 [Brevundimonas phage vB_BpoS-Domovoi]|uniref:Uncharacterized protein n=1 Tax=Brevundimonas phage vB_BpoS-Domovoi TaxID=2948598 RepID=A0A9E7SKB8_9CAUD|nr:hypothetical protein DOMOVOI_02960 [Brevundimonas phage vB_BpoS-Domovoi]